jgi:hydroxysqualene synthase
MDNAPVGVGHYENFPVASLLCPPRLRAPIRAIYAFARTADDIADEGDADAAQRLHELARFRAALQFCCGASRSGAPLPLTPPWAGIFSAVQQALQDHRLSPQFLHDLLDAFEQDVHNPPYATREALLDYCRRSANPIGRLLLQLYGIDDPTSQRQSDALCSALQLINFWQDLSVDVPRGRVYLPHADLRRHGLEPTHTHAWRDDIAMRALVKDLVAWAARLLAEGAPLPLRVPGRAGWELRLVAHGGWRILEKIVRMDGASMARRPRLHLHDVWLLAWRSLRYRSDWFTAERLA